MACTGTPVHDNPVFTRESWSLCNLPKWNKNQLHSSDLSYLWWLHTSVIRDADKIRGNYAEAKIILEWPVFIYCKLPVCIPVHVYFSRNNTVNCFCKFKCLVSARQKKLSLRDFSGFTHEGQCFSPVLRSGYVVTSPEIQLENKQVGGWSSMCFHFSELRLWNNFNKT